MSLAEIWNYIKNGLPHPSTWDLVLIFGVLSTLAKGVEDFFGVKYLGNWVFSGIKNVTTFHGRLEKTQKELKAQIDQLKVGRETNATMLYEILARMEIADELDPALRFKMDVNWNYTFVNRAYLNYFGFNENDVMDLCWQDTIPSSDMVNLEAKLHRAIKNKSDFVCEHHVISKGGETYLCKTRAIPLITGENKKVIGFIGQIEIINKA